jgi:hypothetical protein
MHCQHTALVVSAGDPNTQLPAISSTDTPCLSFDHPNHPLKRMSAPVLNRANLPPNRPPTGESMLPPAGGRSLVRAAEHPPAAKSLMATPARLGGSGSTGTSAASRPSTKRPQHLPPLHTHSMRAATLKEGNRGGISHQPPAKSRSSAGRRRQESAPQMIARPQCRHCDRPVRASATARAVVPSPVSRRSRLGDCDRPPQRGSGAEWAIAWSPKDSSGPTLAGGQCDREAVATETRSSPRPGMPVVSRKSSAA